MYEPRTYQPLASVAPVGVSDMECARVLVWREGFGWVERPVESAPAENERVVPPEQEAVIRAWLRWPA